MHLRSRHSLLAALSCALAALACSDRGGTGPDSTSAPPVEAHSGWYVAPTGASTGDGTSEHPLSLASALSGAGGRIQPGDTVWLRGGTYAGKFTSTLAGSSAQPVIVRQYPGERATVDGSIDVTGDHVWFWDFEITSSAPAPGNVTGLSIAAADVKAIDLVVHGNGGSGIAAFSGAVGAELYGNLVFDNGRQRVTRGYAHGIYVQNDQGAKELADNIVFHQFGFGVHAYGEDGAVRHLRVDGNVAFHNGVGTTSAGEAEPDLFFGALTPVRDLTITDNMTWHEGYAGGSVWIGYASCRCVSSQVTLENNYFAGGLPVLRLQRLSGMSVVGNTLVGAGAAAGTIEEKGMPSAFSWRNNTYYGDPATPEFEWDGGRYTFAAWRSSTGFGGSDAYLGARPSGTRIFVRPNKYESGRANVIVYNWDRVPTVPVDLSAVLRPGDAYEIRNAQTWFAPPVAIGDYAGAPVFLPMTPATPPPPPGGWVTPPPPTEPEFGVFVVLKR
ncbi:MAG TPA: hypothetical protein VFS05_04045 [Gemmatimonadaceae bacterium]|nr:hypothetical protein [Gemmatimonadaceae bacterium]